MYVLGVVSLGGQGRLQLNLEELGVALAFNPSALSCSLWLRYVVAASAPPLLLYVAWSSWPLKQNLSQHLCTWLL